MHIHYKTQKPIVVIMGPDDGLKLVPGYATGEFLIDPDTLTAAMDKAVTLKPGAVLALAEDEWFMIINESPDTDAIIFVK